MVTTVLLTVKEAHIRSQFSDALTVTQFHILAVQTFLNNRET